MCFCIWSLSSSFAAFMSSLCWNKIDAQILQGSLQAEFSTKLVLVFQIVLLVLKRKRNWFVSKNFFPFIRKKYSATSKSDALNQKAICFKWSARKGNKRKWNALKHKERNGKKLKFHDACSCIAVRILPFQKVFLLLCESKMEFSFFCFADLRVVFFLKFANIFWTKHFLTTWNAPLNQAKKAALTEALKRSQKVAPLRILLVINIEDLVKTWNV